MFGRTMLSQNNPFGNESIQVRHSPARCCNGWTLAHPVPGGWSCGGVGSMRGVGRTGRDGVCAVTSWKEGDTMATPSPNDAGILTWRAAAAGSEFECSRCPEMQTLHYVYGLWTGLWKTLGVLFDFYRDIYSGTYRSFLVSVKDKNG